MKSLNLSFAKFNRKVICTVFKLNYSSQILILPLFFILLKFQTTDCVGQTAYNKFIINEFIVEVIKSKPDYLHKQLVIPDQNSIDNLERRSFSGNGNIKILDNIIPIKYKNIKVRWNKQRNIFVAYEGQVEGSKKGTIAFSKSGIEITIDKKTILIKPNASKATVTFLLPVMRFADRISGVFPFISEKCSIASDGSIQATDFKGEGIFHLKETMYSLMISRSNNVSITIGSFQTDENGLSNRNEGIVFQGKDSSDLFTYKAHLYSESLKSQFVLTLKSPVKRMLEYDNNRQNGYFLGLETGEVSILYTNNNLKDCNGKFNSKVLLPSSYNQLASEPIDTQRLILNTDKFGALFNIFSLQKPNNTGFKFRLSEAYSVETVSEGAWLYFPQWMKEYSSYSGLKKEECYKIQTILNAYKAEDQLWYKNRPGITLNKGIFYLTSSQINCSYPINVTTSNDRTIKSIFNGNLTLTPYGVTGRISSSGNTLVPFSYPTDSCMVEKIWPIYTWEQINNQGDRLPVEVKGKFLLQELKILDMKIDSLSFCSNEFEKTKSRLTYTIHFPYPSYINLEFEDLSLDNKGEFHQASGPLVPKSFSSIAELEADDYRNFLQNEKVKGVEVIMNPQTYILWAWRLPISLVDKGVIIKFDQLKNNPNNGIFVTMTKSNRNSKNEIYSNELWLPPLFSDSSAVKKGVRFFATFNSKGNFTIHDWDKRPFFGMTYTKKFDCNLSTITLDSLRTSLSLRSFDFKWLGSLWFPYFCDSVTNSWQHVEFNVKSLVPRLISPTNIVEATRNKVCCNDDQENWNRSCPPILSVSVQRLNFDWKTSTFNSNNVTVYENNNPLIISKLELYSFTNAQLILRNTIPVDISISTSQTGNCGSLRTIKEQLKNALRSDGSLIDLICYDRHALLTRNLGDTSSTCCNLYYYGDYQISSISDGNERIILSSNHVKYYPSRTTNKFEFSDCTMNLRSDDETDVVDHKITIPGMQLSEVNGGYYGAFGATYTPVAMSLPYEGASRIFIDPKCGYFYLSMEGTFTYFLTFRGLLFLFHAPFEKLLVNPFPYGTTDLITDMRMRSICPSNEEFLNLVQLTPSNGVNNNSVITGFLTTGNASYGFNYKIVDFELSAGSGIYFYQNKRNSITKYNGGLISNAKGTAAVDVGVAEVSVNAYTSNSLSATIPGNVNYHHVCESLAQVNFATGGNITIVGCAGIPLAHCDIKLSGGISLSKEHGFEITSFDGSTGCESGGCPD